MVTVGVVSSLSLQQIDEHLCKRKDAINDTCDGARKFSNNMLMTRMMANDQDR